MEQQHSHYEQQQTPRPKHLHMDSASGYHRFIKVAFYTVWTVLGLMIIALLWIALLGSGTWQENLNISEQTVLEVAAPEPVEPANNNQQPAAPPSEAEPIEPTQEELACIAEQVSEERLMELQQGQEADAEETAIIQGCLQPR